MDRPTRRFLEFGSFRIDTEDGRLFENDSHIPLAPKLGDLLILLAENNGHTLTKDELMDRIWPGTVVEENSLTRSISILRKTLGDASGNGSYIHTVPKRGYRFEADVHVVLEDEEELIVERRTNYSVTLHNRQDNGSQVTRLFPILLARRAYIVGLGIVASVIVLLGISWTSRVGDVRGLAMSSHNSDRAVDPEALELYNRGRDLWRARSAAGLHQATILLEQAVERDANFALGHAALADAYAFDTGNWKKVEETANRAIELDPGLGEAYAAIGFVKLFWEWQPAEAEAQFRKSIALAPDYPTAHQWYAAFLAADTQFNEALFEIDRAVELDPDSLAAATDRCQILYFLQRYEQAEIQCKQVLSVDPNFFAAHLHLYDIYTASGRFDEAVAAFFRTEQLAVNHSTLPDQLAPLKDAYDRGGIKAFWRARLDFIDKPAGYGGFAAAKYYARLGDNDRTVDALYQAYERRDFDFPFFRAEPMLRKCCSDLPGHQKLLALWRGAAKP